MGSADRDNDGFTRRVGFDAAADFDSINAGNHDIENKQVRFDASDFDECGDTVGSRRDFVISLALKKRFQKVNDLVFVVDNQNVELSIDKEAGVGI